MKSIDEERDSPLLHQAEASNLMESIRDRTAWQLLAMSTTDVAIAILRNKKLPVARFDMLFFAQVMQDICSKHELLRTILTRTNTE
jgi:hypothetical protein